VEKVSVLIAVDGRSEVANIYRVIIVIEFRFVSLWCMSGLMTRLAVLQDRRRQANAHSRNKQESDAHLDDLVPSSRDDDRVGRVGGESNARNPKKRSQSQTID
jgi:membrane glycosyltransferase